MSKETLGEKYLKAKNDFNKVLSEYSDYIGDNKPKIDKIINAILTTVYKVDSDDIEWDFYEPSYTLDPYGGMEDNYPNQILIPVEVDDSYIYLELRIKFERLDDPNYLKELIAEEVLIKAAADKRNAKANKKTKKNLQKELDKLQEKIDLLESNEVS